MTGSVKNATKSRTDELIRPVLALLDYATSRKREDQSILLRDLKIGVNHIDKDQLRRDEPAIAAFFHSTKADEAIEKVRANSERLHGAEVEALGEDWANSWWANAPSFDTVNDANKRTNV